jgi:FtsP/CotA-like multicopper oxidase with cupredoxin domain
MLGNLYVEPAQDGTTIAGFSKFVYNDGDGSTGYDVAVPLQLSSMDPVFHDLHLGVQPLPFKDMKDTYAMINGRGYPDTVNTAPLPAPVEKSDYGNTDSSQPIHSLVTATKGQRVLLRLSNLSVINYYTVTAQGLPMKVVGAGARQLRGPDGKNLYYDTTSVTLGGGESAEVLIDTSQVEKGTYFLYTTNLNYLSNNDQDNGGMMTEVVIN